MNWKALLKTLGHAAAGAAAVTVAQQLNAPGTAMTAGNILLPAAASAITSILSLLAQSPVPPAPKAE